MRHYRLKALACIAIVIFGILSALPGLLPSTLLQATPNWYSEHKPTLGLDLRGGSHLLLRVETDELFREQSLRLTDTSAQTRKDFKDDVIERTLEVVRRRMDETGVVEPLITRQGADGILVQLPGVEDPARIKELLGRTARLTFHLVAQAGNEPGSLIQVPGSQEGEVYPLEKNPLLEGGDLSDARLGFDATSQEPVVNFTLNGKGAETFANITRHNIGRAFAIVLDDTVITAPVIRSAISGGSGQISGSFTAREAGDLALLMRAGSLPAPLSVVEERTVGPELGQAAIDMGITTGLLGALLVLGFMLLAYGSWGLIANLSLLVYISLVMAVLAAMGATLTLPGIAGLILSLGMAVDANILINERIREESKHGVSGMYALHLGFQRAFGTILDSNITTLIAVGLLFMFGAGPVRGFAVTMAVGLVVSMFTSITVTRLVMEWRVRKLGRQPLNPGGLSLFDKLRNTRTLAFMKVRAVGILLSIVLSAGSLALLVTPGLNTGIDFKGGTLVEVHTSEETDAEQIRHAISMTAVGDAAVQSFGDEGQYLVRLPQLKNAPDNSSDNSSDTSSGIQTVKEAVLSIAPQAEFPRVEMVGPSVSNQFFETSMLAVLLAGVGMLGYLWFRFEHHFATAIMATLALDLSKTLGFFVLAGIEFNLTAIAALLALIGYSVNDKVVIFDRIRESLRQTPDMPFKELINQSLTSTLTRTLFTSVTTFLAILPMGIAGGDAVASFALPMLFGIVAGTSSSLFIAAPILQRLHERAIRKGWTQTQTQTQAAA
ncbi:protein translocase subunit SecD [Nitrincola alkalilacustris]|uniref:protein translocase subunit SecD n=1 Tax=Nitrincola alkalilacustris TaxID=1571224 RepID=UPI00124EA9F0|nr:protein translocase subunit SecD [Nitrincola alkalilacustris]